MPPKHKHNSKATANSQPIAGDNVGDTVKSSHAKQLRADQLFDSEPVSPTDPEPNTPQPRHSSHHGKGSGGQLQQLLNLKCMQTGQVVNPMAPGYSNDDNESQILPWALKSTADCQSQPMFTLSQPGQLFGFRIPSQSMANSTSRMHSIKSHSSSLSSHRSSNVGPIVPVEHIVMWKIPSLLLKDGYHNSTCLQQVMYTADAPPCNSCIHAPYDQPSSAPFSHIKFPSSHSMLAGHDEDRIGSARVDLVVDEVSPSEDNHFAKSVVCSEVGEDTRHGTQPGEEHSQSIRSHSQDICLSGPVTTQRDVEDVVAQHCQCNHGLHLPDSAQLMAIHSQQTSEASCHIRHSDVEGQTSPSNDVIPAPSHSFPAAKSATSGMTSDSNSDPSQLQFYPPSVHVDFNHKACDYVLEAITEHHSKVIAYENKILIYVAIYKGWWLNYTTSITKLLWEDLGNWCSSLKKKACFFVHECYEWDSQNCHDINASITRKLLECSDFLKDGMDKEGHTNNLAHPALSTLIIKFFYTGTNAMANIFPEAFQNEIKVTLDEVVAEGKEVTFKCNIYVDVYADVLGLMAKCDTAPVHCAKTKACHVQWAKVRRNGGSTGTTTGFNVDLD
ncbi:hypothetical protein EDC04DRAFT_2614983 [Pisolithus marmoratus]|nr:hypothetical protein EDC04DRAFT_2614983 [Pisolithus marmoratus]